MATAKKVPARKKAAPKVRKSTKASTQDTTESPRKRVVKTATRKSAGEDPRAARVAARQRRLQDLEKAKDARASKQAAKKKPAQAGTRRQPEKMPAQHIAKPGNEHELSLAPRFLAPDYTGSGKLKGMRAIVTGGDSGIGRAVAVLFAREGADVAVLYLDEHEDARALRELFDGCRHGRGIGAQGRLVQPSGNSDRRTGLLRNHLCHQIHGGGGEFVTVRDDDDANLRHLCSLP